VTVRHLQLAHNEWDAAAGTSRMKVVHSFGREDELDRAAIERLIGSLTRLLDPGAAAPGDPADLAHRLTPDRRRSCPGRAVAAPRHRHAIGAARAGRRVEADRVERILFGLTAKLACPRQGIRVGAAVQRG
jgi:hypothetical protein